MDEPVGAIVTMAWIAAALVGSSVYAIDQILQSRLSGRAVAITGRALLALLIGQAVLAASLYLGHDTAAAQVVLSFDGTSIDCSAVSYGEAGSIRLKGSAVVDGTVFRNLRRLRPSEFEVDGKDVYAIISANCPASR